MKLFLLYIFFFVLPMNIKAQCGLSNVCNSNTGIFSNNNAAEIAYDNMGSSFHSTFIKETNSVWKVWGEKMSNDGNTPALSPIEFNVANYPALSGIIYKMAIGSASLDAVQLIVLTSTGLFVLGSKGIVMSELLTTATILQKITVNGKFDGLPTGVSPTDVKMMFASTGVLTITTCNGAVFILSLTTNIRGNGGTGNELQWSKVMIDITTSLTNIIVCRGVGQTAFALKSDGSLWTWGLNIYLGNGTAIGSTNFAKQMTLPAGLSGIKSIQATNSINGCSYYILSTDRKIYSLGENTYGQLGDRTNIQKLSWVNATNPDNTIITDAVWISANEHDVNYPALAVIKTGGLLYTGGYNARYMVGASLNYNINFLEIPSGVNATDVINYAEAGGHTCALIKQGSPRYGYVGHRINGSMGDGLNLDVEIPEFDFIIPPIINVCGTNCNIPTIATISPICSGQNAIFTINAIFGDILTYNINGGLSQNIVINNTNTASITINNALSNQTLNLIQLTNSILGCVLSFSISKTIIINPAPIAPTFIQVSTICEGQVLNPLPTISTNGIFGSWSPAVNNLITTVYLFTPNNGICANSITMTIFINPKITPTFSQVAPICAGITISQLPTTSTNGVNGTWTPAINNQITTNYLFIPNSGICANSSTMTIIVNQKATPIFAPFTPICYNTISPILPNTSLNGYNGTWQPPIVNNMLSDYYQFTPNPNQCTNLPPSIYLKVYDDFNFNVIQKCDNNNLMLQIQPINVDLNNANYTWTNASNSSLNSNNSYLNLTEYFNTLSVKPIFPLILNSIVTLTSGCSKTNQVIIDKIYCAIQKGISPNNDNQNDFFDLELLHVKELKIFNRYGLIVYSKDNYTTEWIGQNNDNQDLPAGTYYYIIEFKEDKSSAVGWIYLNREQ